MSKTTQGEAIISHRMALRWLRAYRCRQARGIGSARPLGKAEANALLKRTSPGRAIICQLFPGVSESKSRIDVLVHNRKNRPRTELAQGHVCSSVLPEGSIWQARTPGLYVCSPELLFAQMSRTVSYAEACLLALELCGTFTMRPNMDDCLYEIAPLTSVARMAKMLDALGGFGSDSIARQVLKIVKDNSASRMESRTFVALAAPRAQGGFALPVPEINGPVTINDEQVRFLNSTGLSCDLYWRDANLAVEYDSKTHHGSSKDLSHTLDRRTVLNDLGIRVVSMTGYDINSFPTICKKAGYLLKALGIRRQPPSQRTMQRRLRLIREMASIDWV